MAKLTQIDSAKFQTEVLESSEPVLVDFYADWCPPCRALAPTLENLANEFDGRARILKVNVDENPDLAGRYNVRSIPTLALFQDGEVADVKVGALPQAALRSLLENAAGAQAQVA